MFFVLCKYLFIYVYVFFRYLHNSCRNHTHIIYIYILDTILYKKIVFNIRATWVLPRGCYVAGSHPHSTCYQAYIQWGRWRTFSWEEEETSKFPLPLNQSSCRSGQSPGIYRINMFRHQSQVGHGQKRSPGSGWIEKRLESRGAASPVA